TRSHAQARAHFLRNNHGHRGLTKSWRSREQHVIWGHPTIFGTGEDERSLLFNLWLAGELIQTLRAQGTFNAVFALLLFRINVFIAVQGPRACSGVGK